jgi:hydroxymethylglutaryl-CoA reductase
MSKKGSSRLPGFYRLPLEERLRVAFEAAGLDSETRSALQPDATLSVSEASQMIENVIGRYSLPLGLLVNMQVNGQDLLIPMAIEEPSVVAGASYVAKIARAGGGFTASADPSEMIGQVQLLDITDLAEARRKIMAEKNSILDQAQQADRVIHKLGGGARDLELRAFENTAVGAMLVVHLIYDTCDAMGANALNTALERISPMLERISGGRAHLRILSNLADRRLARARCSIPPAALAFREFSGEQVRDGIVEAWAFAAVDPYRAVTHNKGIMNGIDAVLVATGNDWRAVEAGAHAYAARSGLYQPLSTWSVGETGDLQGALEMPLAVGTVGGATGAHPTAKACLRLMKVERARDFAKVLAAVGLAQNLAALRALATEGIQRGHMSLHARQVALAAGAEGEMTDRVAKRMVEEGMINIDRAREILNEKHAN